MVLASGNGSNLQALLDAINEGRLAAEIAAVFVNRRHTKAQQRAQQNNISNQYFGLAPYLETAPTRAAARQQYDSDLAAKVSAHQPDLVVLAGWMHLLSLAFLRHFPQRVINLHPALPGEFAGPTAISDAWQAHLEFDLQRSGVMVHMVEDERVDEGEVLACEQVTFHPNDTRESFEARMHCVEHKLIVEAVGRYLAKL